MKHAWDYLKKGSIRQSVLALRFYRDGTLIGKHFFKAVSLYKTNERPILVINKVSKSAVVTYFPAAGCGLRDASLFSTIKKKRKFLYSVPLAGFSSWRKWGNTSRGASTMCPRWYGDAGSRPHQNTNLSHRKCRVHS